MYAIIKTGGKQYRVRPGQTLRVEKLDGAVGDAIELNEVLLLGGETDTQIGTPLVAGAAVAAEIVDQGKGRKIIVFKKKRRKGYHKKQGHRQLYTGLKITEIRA